MNNSIYQKLVESIREMEQVVVAFSGGVDSSFLTYAAHEALGSSSDRSMLAITIATPYIPAWEIEEARSFAKQYKIAHEILRLPIPDSVLPNPPDRCYFCKKEIFNTIRNRAKELGIGAILEGSNKDDLNDYRPGMRALGELHIISPLLQMGLNKEAIRSLSRETGLKTWNKPAYACLLSRIPYHTEITAAELTRIAKAEIVLRDLGIAGARVRSHGDIARIEVPLSSFADFFKTDVRTHIIEKIKICGYHYVTLDLEGYQTGSLNKTLDHF